MKKIIKTLLVVMVVVLALTVFVGCEEECQHTGGTATCTEAAVCEVCGESYGAALGHVLEKLPAIDATCSKEGRTEGSYCKVCKATVVAQQPIEKTEHVWVANEDRDFTCELDGFTGGNHCEICGVQDGNVVITKAHCVWGEEYVYAAPTCGTAGIIAHDCTVCGTKEKVSDIPATGEHSFTVDVPAKDPTCLDGYTAHKACEVCGAPNEDYEVIPGDPENGHHFAEENTFVYAEPTCTEQGMLAGYCSYCEKPYGLSYIPALGHTWEGGDCETTGTCSVCGAVSEGPIHTLVDGACSVCGYVLVETAEELVAALEAGKKVLLMNDIEMDATLKCPYGNSVGVAQKGGELNGNGYTLTVNGSGNYYAIITYGGTIKNLTINSGFRAVVTYTPTEDVVLDNVTIVGDSIGYGFNTAEHATLEGIDLVVKNSTICGWVSFDGGFESVSFENCNFVQGTYNNNVVGRLVKPYVSTTFTNCTFVKNAYLDLSALAAGETVTLVGCKVAGVDVTVDVFTTEEDHAEIPFTYEAPAGVELVLTAVEGGVSFHRHGYADATCTAPATCACGATEGDALAHSYTDGICGNCGATDPNHYFVVSIADALKKSEGAKIQLSGTVTEIYQAYSSQYNNISVWITDENGDRILVFRVTGNYGIGDKLTIKGTVTMYNEKPQIAQGATVVSSEKHVCSDFTEATCLNKAKCTVCGVETGELAEHNYVDGKCASCGAEQGGVEPTTVSKTMKELITQYGWTSSTTKQTFTLDDNVTVKINGGSNTGKAYNGDHIRLYATDSPAATVTITVPEGYELVSIKITTQTGTYAFLQYNGADICNKTVSVSGNSIVLNSVKNGSDGKQVRVTGIEVTYKPVS